MKKRSMVSTFLVNLLICCSTLAYGGMPERLYGRLMQISQTVVAALAGAAMYGAVAAGWSMEAEERARQELEDLRSRHRH